MLFDWDTFFAATLAAIGDRDLAYANAMEILREETPGGFVPNYARPGGWKSFDRSEPPVGAITVLGLYQKFHDRWFLADTFEPLLSWNRWWDQHRQIQGYLAWGNDAKTDLTDPDDGYRETRQGAIYESGLDNSPMYDGAIYDQKTHLLEVADVGLMSLYIADCDALAQIADVLGKTAEARELRDRSGRYRAKPGHTLERAGRDLSEQGSAHRPIQPPSFANQLLSAAGARGHAGAGADDDPEAPAQSRRSSGASG